MKRRYSARSEVAEVVEHDGVTLRLWLLATVEVIHHGPARGERPGEAYFNVSHFTMIPEDDNHLSASRFCNSRMFMLVGTAQASLLVQEWIGRVIVAWWSGAKSKLETALEPPITLGSIGVHSRPEPSLDSA